MKTRYFCKCGKLEQFRAMDNVPDHAHYCTECAKWLPDPVKYHLVDLDNQS